MQVKNFKELIVWQKSMDLVVVIYKSTELFPKSEIYGLTSQIRRAAISIPSNISEGNTRGTKKDYRHFLLIAFGSGAELETQIEIAKRLDFGKDINFKEIDDLLNEVMKMLNVIIKKLDDTNL